ncbi:glycogen debranching protein [Salegentibacter sp. JZCK2]|uniref:alpha-L-rhamnosidase-related protein n=1 Tax=Salegentibacter tibetensis TaxID=2873600 RepID=UPI001CCAE112|nr:glycogen debranching protein [Salegentibacter tibetensis]MBZ9729960.1 glycogen debranching protein [Salegentibacter tibetensis]
MKKISLFSFSLIFSFNLLIAQESFTDWTLDTPHISGKAEYLDSPFVTAGDRVYVVGHQNGNFPELGWHIQGEMGGVWNHPIKLLDGFSAEIVLNEKKIELNNASEFVNYPFAGKHIFQLENNVIEVTRWQFVPDGEEGLAVQYIIQNNSSEEINADFIFTASSDLRPTWLGDRTGMVDHKDVAEFLPEENAWLIKDENNPWFTVVGADRTSEEQEKSKTKYKGKGISTSQSYKLTIRAGGQEVINFSIAGSFESRKAVLKTYNEIRENLKTQVADKKERYKGLANKSKLTIPDKNIEQAFEWLKYNSDWLVQTVPGIGTGITAGIPDYPWWFGVDSEYALQGYMMVGQTDAVYSTIKLLDSMSEVVNGNGKIIHEMSTNGAVFNDGNINETPQFASLIWEIFKWNGDLEFLKKYFPTIKKGLEWLQTQDTDANLFPEGFGMMEIHGLDSEMIDVAVYSQKAFADASKMAAILEEQVLAREYADMAENLKKKINEEFWSEEFNSYADFIGTDKQAFRLIDDAIVRADTLEKPWAVKELKETKAKIEANPSEGSRPFVVHHNWVVNTPMETKIAEPEKALKALNTAEKYRNPFGVFVTGIDRDEVEKTEENSFKGGEVFTYTGAVMTLPTAVQIIAENNYGRPEKALDYLERMTRSFSFAFPGSMYEVSPDYGMISQAWNIYGYAVPIVSQFFGIQPEALNKKVVIQPQMPDAWNEASLENVELGENEISVYYSKTGEALNIEIFQIKNWELELVLPNMADLKYELTPKNAEVSTENGNLVIKGNSDKLEISIKTD